MDQRVAIEKALTIIEDNLYDLIDVIDIANKVGYSYYHFSRLFSAVLGESISSYINKRRLAISSKRLIYSDDRILEIALDSGYASAEAYSRAFKLVYNVSPITYRNNKVDSIISNKRAVNSKLLEHITSNVSIEPDITYIDNVKIFGIRGKTTLDDNCIPDLWDKFFNKYKKSNIISDNDRFYGICEVDEKTLFSMNNKRVISQFVGVEFNDNLITENGLIEYTLTKGRYAVFTHKGSLATIHQTYEYIWSTWFLTTKEEIDNRADFEFYDHRFLGHNNLNSKMFIYIPII